MTALDRAMDEQALLGSVLYDPAAYQTAAHLRPTDFQGAGHSLIWESITRIVTAGHPIDPATVVTDLTARGELERAGGAHAIVELATGVFLPGHAGVYAQLITERSARRWMGDAGRWLASEAAGTDSPAILIDRAIEGLATIRDSLSTRTAGPGRSYKDLLALEFTEAWVSPNYLAPQDRLILTGREGLGKSTLMRQIAVSVAAGLDPFTHHAVPEKRVLVIDCENSDALNQGKYHALIRRANHYRGGSEIPRDQLVIESRVDGLDLTGQRDSAWLLSVVAANAPDLVVIGPIYKLHTGNPHDEEPARKVIAALDRVRATGAALAMEAHAPHGEDVVRPYGASIWLRWPEFGYGIKRVGNDGYELMAWRGPRDQRSFPTRLARGGSWPWRDADQAEHQQRYADPADIADRGWPSLPQPGAM